MRNLFNKRNNLSLLTFLLLFTLQSNAQTTIASGDWNSTSTWQNGQIPTSGQNPTINHVVTVSSGNITVNGMTISANDDSYGGIVISSGAALISNGQIYSATTSKRNIKIIVSGTLTATNINLNSSTDGKDADSLVVNQGATLTSGQFLYTKTSGQKGGLIITINGIANFTNGFQHTNSTDNSDFTFNIGSTGNCTITAYNIFNNKGKSDHNFYVNGNLTFVNGWNLQGETNGGQNNVFVGSSTSSGKITTSETVTFKKNDSNGSNKVENNLTLRNGEVIINGELRFEGSDNSTVDYNEIVFENASPYTGLTKKITVKGKLFPYQRPYGKATYNNVSNASSIGFYLSGTANPTIRPDENNNFKFQNVIVETTSGGAYLEGNLTSNNMTGTLTIKAGSKFYNGANNSNQVTLNSYSGQIDLQGTFVNMNLDNAPYQMVNSNPVLAFGTNGILEFYCSYDCVILTGSTFNLNTVATTGTGSKFIQQSLDASTKKVGQLWHQAGILRIGYQPYITTQIEFKLYNNPSMSTGAQTLVIDAGCTVNIPQNFLTDPNFILSSHADGIVSYDMGYSSISSYQKVYPPISGSYGILKISDSNRPKYLESGKLVSVSNYVDITGGATFSLENGCRLTLLSTATRTAYIANLSNGTLVQNSGNIQVQKYIKFDSSYNYRDFTTPIKTATLSSWQNAGLIFSGFTGSAYPSYTVNTYSYTESTAGVEDNGFYTPSNITNTIVTFDANQKITRSGWRSVQGENGVASNFLMKDEGTIFQGNVDYNLSFTSGGTSRIADDGWNFIGNPYPAVLNWATVYSDRSGSDLVSDSITNGISPTIWVWMPEDAAGATYSSGSYTYYNAATGVGDSRASTVSQYQGFFVKSYHSTLASTNFNLRLKESHKSTGTKSFLKDGTSNNQLVVDLKVWDDEQQDVISFHKWNNATNGFDPTYDVAKLAADYAGVIQVEFINEGEPQFTRVNAVDKNAASLTLQIYFKAAKPGTQHLSLANLQQFIQRFTCAQLKDLETGEKISLNDFSQYDFKATDTIGSVRFELIFSNVEIASFTENGECHGDLGKLSGKVKNAGNNSIDLLKGAELIKTYPAKTNVFSEYLPEGDYSLVINEFRLCPSANVTLHITNPAPIVPDFNYSLRDCTPMNPVGFMNTTTGAAKFNWTFGDATASTEDQAPTHIFEQSGEFTITLNASNEHGNCTQTISKKVLIDIQNGISENTLAAASVIVDNNQLKINNLGTEPAEVNVYLSNGQLIDSFRIEKGLSYHAVKANHLLQVVITSGLKTSTFKLMSN